MKAMFLAAVGCLTLALAGSAGPQGKDQPDQAKLVGFWEVVKGDETPPGSTVQFTNDGKIILTMTKDGKEKKLEAAYKVEGHKLTTTRKAEGKVEVNHLTIKTLTDAALVTVNEKGKTEELKKIDKK